MNVPVQGNTNSGILGLLLFFFMVFQTSTSLRKYYKQKRRNLSLSRQQIAAQKIFRHLLPQIKHHKNCRHIAAYLPLHGEVDVRPIIKWCTRHNRVIYLPRIHQDTMIFYAYPPFSPLYKNAFGILEPAINTLRAIRADQLDIVLTPLVAFDHSGNRLGMGGGFYDRFLSHKHRQPNSQPQVCGIAYAFQKTHRLDTQKWDVPLDQLICETKRYQW